MKPVNSFLASLAVVCTLVPSAQALTANPGSIDFGVVRHGTASTKTFSVTNNEGTAIDIVVSSTKPEFKPRGTELNIAAGATKSITVDVSNTTLPGLHTGQIQLKAKNARALAPPLAVVGAQVTVIKITADPATTDVGTKSAPLVNQTFTVKITNQGPVPLTCTATPQPAGPGGLITISPASLNLAAGAQAALTVTFNSKNITQRAFDIAGAAKCTAGTTNVQAEFHIKGSYNVFSVNAPVSGSIAGQSLSAQVTGNAFASAGSGLVCGTQGGTGGTAFGGGGDPGVFTCFGAVGGGSQVTLTATIPSTANFKWTNGTGSASSCNNSTAPTCSFSIGADTAVRATYTAK